jgi:D-glycero-alpha-D-manno-heptose 1-phosphate guanylyltransferase
MITEAIILAGGLGTRLRSVVSDLPKCMALVHGKPFLDYVIHYAIKQGIQKIILAVGYKSDTIKEYYSKKQFGITIIFSEEEEPLGTGGAIALALTKTSTEHILVTNGDTLYEYNIQDLSSTHLHDNALVTLCLQPMQHFDRYGVVKTKDNRIKQFEEKKVYAEGLINAGVYSIHKKEFLEMSWPSKFSFEKEFLEAYLHTKAMYATVQNNYFIDIGIPEDYEKAQKELAAKYPIFLTKTTTLFLDRDGVLNEELPMDYVKKWEEFIFYRYTLGALAILSQIFNKIFIVTNQKGVGKQLMTQLDLDIIHQTMLEQIQTSGGRIDKIYYCTALENEHPCRKPNAGMALEAKKDFPQIDLHNSIMVGNNMSDMQFGKNAGMQTILVTTTNKPYNLPNPYIDMQATNLLELAQYMQELI